jgi:gas vesicle protein
MIQKDSKEGRSSMSRKMYMEAKNANKDKATQLRELEKYMQELSTDITEMIADASPEEKQYLEKKITALASKIGQMK